MSETVIPAKKAQPLSRFFSGFGGKAKGLGKALYKTRYLQLLILPGLIYFIIFDYLPMYGVLIAFKDYHVAQGIMGSPWVGLKYFYKFFNHPDFWRLIKNTVILSGLSLVIGFPLPILFALLLNEVRSLRYKKFVQTVSYLPHFISLPAIIGMVAMALSPTDGVVNRILVNVFHMESIYFLVEPGWFRPIYITTGVWTGIGWGAIIYIAALSNVDQELYESATLDGATRFQQMMKVSLPSIMPTVIIMFIMTVGKLMSVSADKALLLQVPQTYETSDIISTFVYRRGLINGEYSFSTAVDIFNSVINIMILIIANKIARKVSDTSLW